MADAVSTGAMRPASTPAFTALSGHLAEIDRTSSALRLMARGYPHEEREAIIHFACVFAGLGERIRELTTAQTDALGGADNKQSDQSKDEVWSALDAVDTQLVELKELCELLVISSCSELLDPSAQKAMSGLARAFEGSYSLLAQRQSEAFKLYQSLVRCGHKAN